MKPDIHTRYPTAESWYVVYVKSRTEKKVVQRLEAAHITCLLPLYKSVRQWSDRKKTVQLPLFPGYLFVHIRPDQFEMVRRVEGVVQFVRTGKNNATVPDSQIQSIITFMQTGVAGVGMPADMAPGEKVRVSYGPLAGCTGELAEIRNEKQFIVRIEAISQVLVISIPPAYLEKISTS